ncbi:MAG: ABC transporter permease [Gammaproteobacteria bacterium]|nr:ABC transporter permease [Gammaproteobacteria bacterium]
MKPVSAALVIARYSFTEATRNRMFLLTLVGLVCAFGIAEFISELAITESSGFATSVLAPLLRLFCVFIIGLFIITSIVREFNDKGFDHMLALPYPRYVYYFGKLLGFGMLAAVVVFSVSIILLFYSGPGPGLFWCLSLILEVIIVVCLSLLFVFTFKQVTLAFSGVMAFYLLARSMETIQLISDSPLLQTDTLSQAFINGFLDLISFILPRLDMFARTEWLVYASLDMTSLTLNLLQTAVYVVLLSACSLFDLYRMEI